MKLSVFDFDVTLMRPDGSWNERSVAAARRAYARGYSVLLTGRPEAQRADVVKALVNKGIPFHRIVTVGPLFIGSKKRSEIDRLIRAIGITDVEIWDDNADLLASYGQLVDSRGLPKSLHLVRG